MIAVIGGWRVILPDKVESELHLGVVFLGSADQVEDHWKDVCDRGHHGGDLILREEVSGLLNSFARLYGGVNP